METAPFTRTDESRPTHVERLHLAAQQRRVHGDHLGGIGDSEVVGARAHALGERPDVGNRDRCGVAGDRVVERVTIVDLTEDGVLEQHLVAGRGHDLRVEQPPEEEVSPVVHRLAESRGVVEQIVGSGQLSEPIR